MKNRMFHAPKYILTTICFFCFIGLTFSQEKSHELGVRFNSFQDFDFIYKVQKDPNKWIRCRLAFTNLGYQKINTDTGAFNFGLGLAIGAEKRKPINGKLSFIHGWEPFLTVGLNTVHDFTNASFQPGIGYVLGFQYDISESFYLNIETTPSIYTTVNINNNDLSDNFNLNAGFNSNALALTVAYRFVGNKQ